MDKQTAREIEETVRKEENKKFKGFVDELVESITSKMDDGEFVEFCEKVCNESDLTMPAVISRRLLALAKQAVRV